MYIMGFQKIREKNAVKCVHDYQPNIEVFFFLLLSASDYRLKQMKVEILNRILQLEVFFNR